MEAAVPASRPTILIAEDDPDIRIILGELLTDAGYDVQMAIDGVEALEVVGHRRHDLILLDIGMPRLDGPGFCRAYRGSGGTAPVILITAASPADVAVAVGVCGAAGFITKPFDIGSVIETVAGLLDDG